MEPIFKVGDTVRIRDIRKITDTIGPMPFGVISEMCSLTGKEFRIASVNIGNYNPGNFSRFKDCDGCLYRIDGDKLAWSWSSPMFEKVVEADMRKLADTSLPTSDETSRPLKLAIKRYNVKLNFKN